MKNMMERHILKKNQVLELIPFNRTINHNTKLVSSLREFGLVNTVKVICTSIWGKKNGLYIIDGQHTYTEAVRLGLSIEYDIILRTDDIALLVKLMGALNNVGNKWKAEDYISCYCAINLEDYVYLRSKAGETGFKYTILNSIYSGSNRSVSNIKNGTFKILDRAKGDLIINYVQDIQKLTNFPLKAIEGFIGFYNALDKYDHKKFVLNLKYSLPMLSNCFEPMHFIESFGTIYSL